MIAGERTRAARLGPWRTVLPETVRLRPAMSVRQLDRGELIAVIGGVLLGISLFLTWYTLGNRFTTLESCTHPQVGQGASGCSGWNSLSVARYVLLLAALAPLILAYIIMRGHALSWPRGELTAVVGVTALVLVLFRGVIDKPGSPQDQITVDYGWWVALVGTLLIVAGAAWRYQEGAPRRNPPGVL
jgi:hypothetical protein